VKQGDRDRTFPDLGMKYEDVRRRVKRIAKDYKNNPHSDKQAQIRLVDSLINQAQRHEKGGAREELLKELEHKSFFGGSGNRSCGFGGGKKLGTGKWQLKNGKWIKI
jgi:hypothetical protein